MKIIIAQLSITPLGEGTSVSRYVKAALDAMDKAGMHSQTSGMSTVLEAETLDEIFDAVKIARDAVLEMGVQRIIIDLKIDDRHDKSGSIESKLRSIGKG